MRRGTGSKPANIRSKVSIQQPLDGHSFSLPEDLGLLDGAAVDVELLSAYTMLVPAEMYATGGEARAASWFAMVGQALPAGMRVVATDAVSGRLALIGIGSGLLEALREKFGEGVRYTTPLLYEPSGTPRCIWVRRCGGLTYVKVYDPLLRYAEVLPWDDDTDLYYFLDRLCAVYPACDYVLRLTGGDTKAVCRTVGKRFKRVICE